MVVVAPAELLCFDPTDWPPTGLDVELDGERAFGAFRAWIRWLHAQSAFREANNLAMDALPDEMAPGAWDAVEASLGGLCT